MRLCCMKKIILCALLLLCSVLVLASCGEDAKKIDPASVTIDIDALAAKLNEGLTFDDEMYLVEDYVTVSLYAGADAAADCVSYFNTGATAEAIAVFAMNSADETAAFVTSLESYRDECINQFERYTAGEIAKLENALIGSYGKYVYFIVCPDSAAAQGILDEAIKAAESEAVA